MSYTPDYVVFRAAPGLPEGQMGGWDGRWVNRATMPIAPEGDVGHPVAEATPTNRFEVRDDGAVAEVWEVRW